MAAEPDLTARPVHVPEIEFIAYAEDCTLSGHIRLDDERLSDLLNAHDSYELVNVLVTPLTGASPFELHTMAVERDEIMLVHALGPRGNAGRRQRTRTHPIVARCGPYEVRGYVHALPGSDPITSFRRRKPMVVLTDAVVEYRTGRQAQSRRVGTLVINRELLDWIVEGEDEKVAVLDLPVEPAGPLAKDFTGQMLDS